MWLLPFTQVVFGLFAAARKRAYNTYIHAPFYSLRRAARGKREVSWLRDIV